MEVPWTQETVAIEFTNKAPKGTSINTVRFAVMAFPSTLEPPLLFYRFIHRFFTSQTNAFLFLANSPWSLFLALSLSFTLSHSSTPCLLSPARRLSCSHEPAKPQRNVGPCKGFLDLVHTFRALVASSAAQHPVPLHTRRLDLDQCSSQCGKINSSMLPFDFLVGFVNWNVVVVAYFISDIGFQDYILPVALDQGRAIHHI